MSPSLRFRSAAILRVLLCSFIVVAFASSAAQPTVAAFFTLVDDNSATSFDTSSQANDFNWRVDGINQLNQQAFWYRVGAVAEQSVHTLPIAVQGTSDTNFDGNPESLFVRYLGNGFRIETAYRLDGGAAGSGVSDLAEQISITNTTGGSLDFHFFQYADFDINGTAGGDTAVFTNVNSVDQFKDGSKLAETVVTSVPTHREIAFFNTTLTKLNDGVPTTLSDTPPIGAPLGPGDMTWAYQWDFSLPPGATFQISKDKNISAGVGSMIPEPASLGLLLIGIGSLTVAAHKRRRD